MDEDEMKPVVGHCGCINYCDDAERVENMDELCVGCPLHFDDEEDEE